MKQEKYLKKVNMKSEQNTRNENWTIDFMGYIRIYNSKLELILIQLI